MSDNEARTQAMKLLSFFKVLYEIDKKNKMGKAKLKDHPIGCWIFSFLFFLKTELSFRI
jgi:hypothetical protein